MFVVAGIGLLLYLLEREGVTILQATPVAWRLLLETGWQGDPKLRALLDWSYHLLSAPQQLLFERLAVAQIAHLDLDECAQVSRGAMLRFHDEVGLAVELDDLAFADVVGCGHEKSGMRF